MIWIRIGMTNGQDHEIKRGAVRGLEISMSQGKGEHTVVILNQDFMTSIPMRKHQRHQWQYRNLRQRNQQYQKKFDVVFYQLDQVCYKISAEVNQKKIQKKFPDGIA